MFTQNDCSNIIRKFLTKLKVLCSTSFENFGRYTVVKLLPQEILSTVYVRDNAKTTIWYKNVHSVKYILRFAPISPGDCCKRNNGMGVLNYE